MQKTLESSLSDPQPQSLITLGQQNHISQKQQDWSQHFRSSSRCIQNHSPSRSRHSHYSTSRSPLTEHYHWSTHSPHKSKLSSTPFNYSWDRTEIIPAPLPSHSVTLTLPWEGTPLINKPTDSHTTFHLTTKQGNKAITVKIDPSVQVNTISLNRYQNKFLHKATKSGNLKKGALLPMTQTWISHDGTPIPSSVNS